MGDDQAGGSDGLRQGGTPVLLIGGFGLHPAYLRPLVRRLRRSGRDVRIADTGWNLDCGEATVRRLETELTSIVTRRAERVSLVGHSRGGQLARVLASREPGLVAKLVTVATPWTIGPPRTAGVQFVAEVLRRARSVGLPVMPSIDCARSECCSAFRDDLERTLHVPWIAIWSRRDRIAGRDSAPPKDATRQVEIDASHLGAALSQTGWQAIFDALAPEPPSRIDSADKGWQGLGRP